mgnify:CR=1 FL=1
MHAHGEDARVTPILLSAARWPYRLAVEALDDDYATLATWLYGQTEVVVSDMVPRAERRRLARHVLNEHPDGRCCALTCVVATPWLLRSRPRLVAVTA